LSWINCTYIITQAITLKLVGNSTTNVCDGAVLSEHNGSVSGIYVQFTVYFFFFSVICASQIVSGMKS